MASSRFRSLREGRSWLAGSLARWLAGWLAGSLAGLVPGLPEGRTRSEVKRSRRRGRGLGSFLFRGLGAWGWLRSARGLGTELPAVVSRCQTFRAQSW